MALPNCNVYRASVDEDRNHITIKTELPINLAAAQKYIMEFKEAHCDDDISFEIVAVKPGTDEVISEVANNTPEHPVG